MLFWMPFTPRTFMAMLSAVLFSSELPAWPEGRASATALALVSVGEPVAQLVGVLLLLAQDRLEDTSSRRILVADQPDHLAIRLDGDALGDQVGANHRLQVSRVVVVGVAAREQRRRCEVGLAAELDNALGDHVGVRRLLVRVDEELLGDLRRVEPLGGEVVALVAQ